MKGWSREIPEPAFLRFSSVDMYISTNLQRQPMPLTGEQERIVSSLVARPDNVRFPNVEMRVRIPAKRKGQGMNI